MKQKKKTSSPKHRHIVLIRIFLLPCLLVQYSAEATRFPRLNEKWFSSLNVATHRSQEVNSFSLVTVLLAFFFFKLTNLQQSCINGRWGSSYVWIETSLGKRSVYWYTVLKRCRASPLTQSLLCDIHEPCPGSASSIPREDSSSSVKGRSQKTRQWRS